MTHELAWPTSVEFVYTNWERLPDGRILILYPIMTSAGAYDPSEVKIEAGFIDDEDEPSEGVDIEVVE